METAKESGTIPAGAMEYNAASITVLEGLEAYRGGLVCYSFGDLVFDHMSRETGETILLRCVVSAKKITAKLIPVYANASGIPSVQHGSSAAAIGLALLTVAFGYLKIDLATGGAYRGRLRLAAATVILGLVVAVVIIT